MEIHTNSSWKKLCTSTWNKVEVDLTCMAMGYSNSSDYGRWYEDSGNVSETSTNFNCTTTLTKCEKSFSNNLQFCKGMHFGLCCDIRAVDLAKTSSLALVIDYVLVFSRRLLIKKMTYIVN